MDENRTRLQTAYGKVVAQAWRDPGYRAELIADPRRVLEQAGLGLPPDVTVKIVENTDKLFHLVLPSPLEQNVALTDEQIEKIAAGSSCAGGTCVGGKGNHLHPFTFIKIK